MESIKNKANNIFMAVATPFIGVLKDSKFLEKGLLTPEEFVIAGDQLTHKCPTWSWESGNDKLVNKNLPSEKQFLITRNVPCPRRIKDLNKTEVLERELDDGWVEAENPNQKMDKDNNKKAESMDIDDMDNIIHGEEKQEEAVDIDDIANDKDNNTNIFANGKYFVMNEPEDTIQKVRSYDLSITYDFFY